ncbi:MAG: radical SAM family heme chaperone HemW [Oscillospiraceae bacterium]|nr:radical SAM family heme chaperone HemW [Oscillospiraceae bacterium]
MVGLYVHIPFCTGKCPYCDFYSVPFDKETAYSYSRAVIRNVKAYGDCYDTVYFGGGTPSLMTWEISEILGKISTAANPEVSIEANPGSIASGDLSTLKNSGVNRISIGVQSFLDSELLALGRKHNCEAAVNAVRLAHDSGFKNISVDLMLGIPNQTVESFKRSIGLLGILPITHISAYMMKIEPNTRFGKNPPPLPDEDTVAEIYLTAVEEFEKLGFSQYEVSNFAKPGYECRHNLKYWRSECYLGIGAGAHSYYFGERFYVPKDIKDFTTSHTQKTVYMPEYEIGKNTFEDYAMMKLRLTEGLTFKECAQFGVSKSDIERRIVNIPPGHIYIDDEKIILRKKGFLISNSIIAKIIYD